MGQDISEILKTGPARVTIDGSDLGYFSSKGVTVKWSASTADTRRADSGETPVQTLVTGASFTVDLELSQTEFELMSRSQIMNFVGIRPITTWRDFQRGSHDGQIQLAAQPQPGIELRKQMASLGAFAETAKLPVKLGGHTAFSDGEFIYVAGGANDSPSQGTLKADVYSARMLSGGQTGTWMALSGAPLPLPQASMGVARWRDHVYLAGGVDSGGLTSKVLRSRLRGEGRLDPWVEDLPLPATQIRPGLVAAKGFLFLILDGGAVHRARIKADGSLEPWSAAPINLPTAPVPATLFSWGMSYSRGYLWIFGGQTSSPVALSNKVFAAEVQDDGNLGPWVDRLKVLPGAGVSGFLPVDAGGYGDLVAAGGATSLGLPGTSTQVSSLFDDPAIPPSAGNWQVEPTLVSQKSFGATLFEQGRFWYLGGANAIVAFGDNSDSIFTASIIQAPGGLNPQNGSFAGIFDLGTVKDLHGHFITWMTGHQDFVFGQRRLAGEDGIFGPWSVPINLKLDLGSVSARYVEIMLELRDPGPGQNVLVTSVSLSSSLLAVGAFGLGIGARPGVEIPARTLRIEPINSDFATGGTKDLSLTVFRAVPLGDPEIVYSPEGENNVYKVSFKALVDSSRPLGANLAVWGDTQALLS